MAFIYLLSFKTSGVKNALEYITYISNFNIFKNNSSIKIGTTAALFVLLKTLAL